MNRAIGITRVQPMPVRMADRAVDFGPRAGGQFDIRHWNGWLGWDEGYSPAPQRNDRGARQPRNTRQGRASRLFQPDIAGGRLKECHCAVFMESTNRAACAPSDGDNAAMLTS